MKRFMTRRRSGQLLLNGCRYTQSRIEEWRRELLAKGPLSTEDEQLLADWQSWNFHRYVDSQLLLCPAPFVRRLRQDPDGSWHRTPAYEAAIAVMVATREAGFRRKRHEPWK